MEKEFDGGAECVGSLFEDVDEAGLRPVRVSQIVMMRWRRGREESGVLESSLTVWELVDDVPDDSRDIFSHGL